ncbi:MAG: anaerobic glycerol-3-phosphate dehydrogenase subunit C [Thermodesulfobacteriota bacterium]
MVSQLSGEAETIGRDLGELVEGEVLFDELSRAMYSSGASIYRIRPVTVVKPKHRTDVVRVVQYASRRGIPIIARGGGTSRAGNEVGEGIILDFSKYMNGILERNPEEKWVRIQPGLILSSLNRFLRSHNLFFPIDPSTKDYCTLGGMIANNSSGPHAVKYGATRDYVLSLEVVLSTGEVIITGPVSLRGRKGLQSTGSESFEDKIYRVIPDLLRRYRGPMEEEKPFTLKNSSGYDLWGLRDNGSLNLTPLFVGSEGTLGIITEAKLRLIPPPGGEALSGLLYFDDLDTVGRATEKILELSPSMVEIMERQILDLAREQRKEMRPYLPEGVEAILYIEFQGESDEQLRRTFAKVRKRTIHDETLAVDMKVASDKADMAMFEKVRSVSGPILNKIKGPKKPLAFVEDAAVHPSNLSRYIKGLRQLFEKYGVEASIYGHAGDGNPHIMVFLDLRRRDEVEKMVALAEACYDLVLSLKGTISGEHGDGRLRTYYLKRQYPQLHRAMAEIKILFDPKNVLNPGCVVGGEGNALNQHLKYGVDDRVLNMGSILDGEWIRGAIEDCSGCGKCRSYCPIAQELLDEWAMGRSKATILRQLVSGHLDPKILDSPEFKELMDSCVNCKRCLTDCPSGANIPWLAMGGRAHYIERHGEPLSSRFFSNTSLLCKTGSSLAPLVNLANSFFPVRQLLEKTVGLDQRRYLPSFRRRTLRKIMRDRPRPKGDKRVVYFLSCYSNFNEPEGDGLATVEVLEHNGFDVLIPDFRCCGIARINAGSIKRVMEDIETNVQMMVSYIEQGLSIVFSEPSCALAVKMEYPRIVSSDAAHEVAEECYDIHQFLMMLHEKGELLLQLGEMNLTVGYHNPCHLRALGVSKEPVELLRLIPGITIKEFSDRCCGLVGTYGMKKKNFDLSMAIGKRLFEEIEDSGVERVSTACGACKLQIFQGTRKEAVHPISLLAIAYKKGIKTRSLVNSTYAQHSAF